MARRRRRALKSTPPEVVTASSQISMKRMPRSNDFHSNYVTLPLQIHDNEDDLSLSDRLILSKEDVLTPRSMSLTNEAVEEKDASFIANASGRQQSVPQLMTTAPTDASLGMPEATQIHAREKNGAERGRA